MVAQLQEEGMLMTTLGLRAKLKDVLDNTSLTDPHDIADALLDQIPKKQYEGILQILLTDYVRSQMSNLRRNAPPPPASALPKSITTKHAGGLKSVGTSAKLASIRDGWQKHLRDRIGVGPNTYKMLAECTYEDLYHAADQRTRLADQNKAWAQRFHAWAALMTDHKVEKFGDLPTEVLMHTLGAQAA